MRLYLAGLDVFRLDARAHGEHLKALCRRFGHEGLYPSDNELSPGLTGPEAAQWIFEDNLHWV